MSIVKHNYEKAIGAVRQLRGLIRREIRSDVGRRVPLGTRIRMIRGGFLSESYVLYELDKNDPSLYLSDLSRWVRTFHIDRSPYLLDDKFVFTVMLESFGCPTAPLRAMVARGKFMSVETGQRLDEAAFVELLRTHGDMVVKPRSKGSGTNIRFVRLDEGRLVVNDQPLRFSQFVGMLRQGQHVVTQRVYQHEYAARIYPGSTNTVRIITMIDVDSGVPFIAAAVHRFGTTASFPVDNWSKGGLSAAVDLGTGQLGPGVAFPDRHPMRVHTDHPDSGAPIAGARIPHWTGVREGILRLAARLPLDNPYVGWDVIVTSSGFVVLEGNRYSDVNLVQVHEPLLADARVRAFFQRYGAA